jgi:hypothetical protein
VQVAGGGERGGRSASGEWVFYCVVTGAEGTPAKGKGGDWRLAALMEAVSGSQTEGEPRRKTDGETRVLCFGIGKTKPIRQPK